jgi:hypothetical protein
MRYIFLLHDSYGFNHRIIEEQKVSFENKIEERIRRNVEHDNE